MICFLGATLAVVPQAAALCGYAHLRNCYMATVGMAFEFGLLGIVLVAASLRYHSQRGGLWWCSAVAGVLTTPMLFGVPLFAFF